MFEEDLAKAVLLSKLEFEKNRKAYDAKKKQQDDGKAKKGKKPPKTVSLDTFQQMTAAQVLLPDPCLFFVLEEKIMNILNLVQLILNNRSIFHQLEPISYPRLQFVLCFIFAAQASLKEAGHLSFFVLAAF